MKRDVWQGQGVERKRWAATRWKWQRLLAAKSVNPRESTIVMSTVLLWAIVWKSLVSSADPGPGTCAPAPWPSPASSVRARAQQTPQIHIVDEESVAWLGK